jgi:ATP-dependent DNA ligase
MAPIDLPIPLIPGHVVYTEAEANESFEQLMQLKPEAEGAVLHTLDKPFQPGKRCWGTQRMKPVPTIDLKVIGFEEAVHGASGNPNGMVGRINVEFTRLHNGTPRMAHIGVGPGTLTHKERTQIWNNQKKFHGRIAEVRYMRDDTYEALRQPTFLRWRDDKTKGQMA